MINKLYKLRDSIKYTKEEKQSIRTSAILSTMGILLTISIYYIVSNEEIDKKIVVAHSYMVQKGLPKKVENLFYIIAAFYLFRVYIKKGLFFKVFTI